MISNTTHPSTNSSGAFQPKDMRDEKARFKENQLIQGIRLFFSENTFAGYWAEPGTMLKRPIMCYIL